MGHRPNLAFTPSEMGATEEFGAEQGPDLTDVLFKQKRKLLDVGESETGASLSPP